MSSSTSKRQAAERLKLRLVGAVQGVGFRYWAQRQARQRNLAGYVCNDPDGSVTVLLIGPDPDLALASAWLRTGPSGYEEHDVISLPLAAVDLGWDPESDFTIAYSRP